MFFAQSREPAEPHHDRRKGGLQPGDSGYVCSGILTRKGRVFIHPLPENTHEPDDFAF
jgi:hypothetical protein